MVEYYYQAGLRDLLWVRHNPTKTILRDGRKIDEFGYPFAQLEELEGAAWPIASSRVTQTIAGTST